jgi:hypothetical protein
MFGIRPYIAKLKLRLAVTAIAVTDLEPRFFLVSDIGSSMGVNKIAGDVLFIGVGSLV